MPDIKKDSNNKKNDRDGNKSSKNGSKNKNEDVLVQCLICKRWLPLRDVNVQRWAVKTHTYICNRCTG